MKYSYIVRIYMDGANPVDKVFTDEDEAIEWFDSARRCMYDKTTINVDTRLCINSKYVIFIELVQKKVWSE